LSILNWQRRNIFFRFIFGIKLIEFLPNFDQISTSIYHFDQKLIRHCRLVLMNEFSRTRIRVYFDVEFRWRNELTRFRCLKLIKIWSIDLVDIAKVGWKLGRKSEIFQQDCDVKIWSILNCRFGESTWKYDRFYFLRSLLYFSVYYLKYMW